MGNRQPIKNFTELNAWQHGHELVLGVYGATKTFPQQERFGLSSQLQRAAVSITSNIAEGFSRQTTADKIHFYHMSLGSCSEVQNQLLIARDIDILDKGLFSKLSELSVTTHKLINGMIRSIKERQT